MRTIEVTISSTGEVTIEAIGFKGGACEAATRAIEEALGTVKKRNHKLEHFQQATTTKAAQRT